MADRAAGLPADATTWRIVFDGNAWSCTWCAAELHNAAIVHKPGCRWVDEIAAEAARQERQRIIAALIEGDPGALEQAFRTIVDDEEAADCALIVAELLRKDAP